MEHHKKCDEKLRKYGFVVASEYRTRVVSALYRSPRTPKQISKLVGLHTSHISKTLSELVEEGIVDCVNPNMKKGRIYVLTKVGKWIARRILTSQREL